MKLKKIGFIYLISYLGIGGIGLSLLPDLTLKLFLSTGDYGSIMPRVVGLLMMLLSFILYNIFKKGYWSEFSPITIQARIPLVIFLFYLYYLSGNDPLFLVLNTIVIPGLILTSIGYLQSRSTQ